VDSSWSIRWGAIRLSPSAESHCSSYPGRASCRRVDAGLWDDHVDAAVLSSRYEAIVAERPRRRGRARAPRPARDIHAVRRGRRRAPAARRSPCRCREPPRSRARPSRSAAGPSRPARPPPGLADADDLGRRRTPTSARGRTGAWTRAGPRRPGTRRSAGRSPPRRTSFARERVSPSSARWATARSGSSHASGGRGEHQHPARSASPVGSWGGRTRYASFSRALSAIPSRRTRPP